MRAFLVLSALTVTIAGAGWTTVDAQDLQFREMRWRDIGPTRAGRARAAAGVASQPNVFYAGFDNGGVWRSTDYGANWVPLFDAQSTGAIGAIGVAPSNPNVIYVGSGAGIIRPDLAIGDGMYKSTDAGKTWQHLGLRDSQMIFVIPRTSSVGVAPRRCRTKRRTLAYRAVNPWSSTRSCQMATALRPRPSPSVISSR